MADVSAAVAWALNNVLMRKTKKDTTQEGTAIVSRIEKDGTIWLSLPGSTGDTPANGGASIVVNPGDTVRWTIRDGRLYVTGNASSPSVGKREVAETVAPVAQAAQDAGSLAGAAKAVADAINQFFWADTNGVHVSSEANNPTGAQNVLLNALGMLFRAGSNNLLALVTGNSPGVTIYDGAGNADGNIVGRFTRDGVVLGRNDESHARLDYHSMELIDFEGVPYLNIRDLRSNNNIHSGTVEDIIINPGDSILTVNSGDSFALHAKAIRGDFKLYYNQVEVSSSKYSVNYDVTPNRVTFNNSQTFYYPVVAVYQSNSSMMKAFTFGTRAEYASSHDDATGMNSVAMGRELISSNICSFASGYESSASGAYSSATNWGTYASGEASHSEGITTSAAGRASHAEGLSSTSSGARSHAQNIGTIAASSDQTALGRYNEADANDTYAVIVGNGTNDSNRSNALTVDWDGNVECSDVSCDDISCGDVACDAITCTTVNGIDVTATVPISRGGTGQTSADAAARALGLAKTKGDTINVGGLRLSGYITNSKKDLGLTIQTPYRFYGVSGATLSGTYTVRQNNAYLFGSTASAPYSLSGHYTVNAVIQAMGAINITISTGSTQNSAINNDVASILLNTCTITLT